VIQGGKIPFVSARISPAKLTDVTYTKIGSDEMILGLVKKSREFRFILELMHSGK